MKKIIPLLTFLVITIYSFGQITTKKIAQKKELIDSAYYDSTKNFLGGTPYKYIGQELYLTGKSETLRPYGYENFVLDYTQATMLNSKNVYKCCDNYNSKYNELAGKYFKVLDVIKHPKAEEDESIYVNKYFLKLQEKESNDIVYYQYSSEYQYSFPFIVVGYFTKMKQNLIGEKFVVRGKNWISHEPMTDINTGKIVSNFEAGKVWKCVDVTIEEKYYTLSLIIQNDTGEQIPLGIDNLKDTYWVFGFDQAEKLKKKYGPENWQKIVNGKIKIGMTKEMVLLSWGEPKKINETITVNGKSEQWVYEDNYIYLTNGEVTAMQ